MDSYQNVFQALAHAKVKYIIVGGVAMNLLGCPRFTNDIDVLLALDDQNLEAMKSAMKNIGYEQRIPLALDELGDEKKTLQLIQEKNLLAYTFFNSREPLYSIDIIVGPSLKFAEFADRQVITNVWGMQLPVVSIDDLIGMKQESNREKDALDVANLLVYKGL